MDLYNTKIAIVGGRDFTNYELLRSTVSEWIKSNVQQFQEISIVSGGAKGADSLAEQFADEFGYRKIIFYPDWNTYGKRAGMIRNGYIIESSDIVFAFWDGKSRGTANSIQRAKQTDTELIIVRY